MLLLSKPRTVGFHYCQTNVIWNFWTKAYILKLKIWSFIKLASISIFRNCFPATRPHCTTRRPAEESKSFASSFKGNSFCLILSANAFFKKFASPEGRIYFHLSIQYSYKVGKYCKNSSSTERVGIYFSGLQFHPWIDLLPQEKSRTAGHELTPFRSITIS
jgi:hypothetical protein